MGLPAVDYRHTTETTQRKKRGSSSSRSRGGSSARAKSSSRTRAQGRPTNSTRRRSRKDSSRAAFSVVCLALMALAVFGLGRVALTVQAAEASYEANQLREDIKAERLEGQLLEVDKSALTTPSRIEAIAGSSMKMADADSVCYLSLPEGAVVCEPVADVPAATTEADASEEDGGVVEALMDMAAEEAQVLLVGDVGLASSR